MQIPLTFVNICPNLAFKNSHTTQSTYTKSLNTSLIKLLLTPVDERGNIISGLKNGDSSGYDDLSSDALMTIMDYCLTPLVHIINRSQVTGIVLMGMKIGRVTPVFEAVDQTEMTNCPISILPFLGEMQRIAFRLMLSSYVCVCLFVCVCVCVYVCVCRVCGPQENGLR